MATSPESAAAEGSRALSRDSIFGPAPILDDENPFDYDELFAQVSSVVKPADIIEKIWICDVVDNSWEIFRLRRLKARLVEGAVSYTLRITLASIANVSEKSRSMKRLVKMWFENVPSAIRRVSEYLKSANINFDTIVARAFASKLESIERLDRLITIAEGRRNAVLREIDRRRANFAQALRGAIFQIEDAQSQAVAPKTISAKGVTDKNAA
jgi:hypothetical protein